MLKHRNIRGFFFVLVISIIGLFLYSRKGTERVYAQKTSNELVLITDLINSIWLGDKTKRFLNDANFKCPSVLVGEWSQLSEEYFRCHFDFFECALQYEFKNNTSLKKLRMKPEFPISIVDTNFSGPIGIVIFQESNYQIKLEPICNRVDLPAKKYESGKGREYGSPRKLFQVFNKISIDRRLFTFGKLRQLKKVNPKATAHITDKPEKFWYEPVGHLSAQQMRNVCDLNGQEILSSEYHDAASFLPKQIKGHHENEFKSPYIYGHNTSFETAINEESCSQIISLGCPAKNFYTKPQFSWVGLSQLHGGLMEYLPSMFHSDDNGNVSPSSIYFKASSMFHHLGLRVKWNGVSAERRNLDFSGLKTEEEITIPEIFEIGFRCISVSTL